MLKKLKRLLNRCIEEKDISYNELKERMQKENILLIDVRSNQEYEEGHLNGAINIPLYRLEQEIEKYVENKEQVIFLYCSSGYRSKQGRSKLEKLGYTNVYSLQEGIDKIWVK